MFLTPPSIQGRPISANGLVAFPTLHICCLAVQFAFHRGPALKEEALVVELTQGEAVADIVQAEPEKILQNTPRSYAPQNLNTTELRKRSQFGRQKQPTKLDYSLHGTKSPNIAELIKFSVGIVARSTGLQ
ncbi:hypothetical protein PCASD_26183 [Puccinia coronata f. sp. avenae]|uniref:Uncharacterized protein n=1 Tax=Puccinia coronata f. sp. avenae TaxID=200324 RepID=A0A2N5TT75_9BASI|nr:hypothetical protein PCASD_26183 [Puccinia coronata f. sp. avenae]